MSTPSITVIIPAYNAAAFIGETIESALNQTLPPAEIIVVDDGSSDATCTAVRGFGERARLIEQAHLGVSTARNAALAVARGDFIALLDADDLWLPEKLEKQIAYLSQHPEIDIIFCMVKQFSHHEEIKIDPRHHILNSPSASGLLARRRAFAAAGGFDTSLSASEFVGWMMAAEEAGLKYEILPEILALRRLHPGNNGRRNMADQRREYVQLLKKRLDRRRTD